MGPRRLRPRARGSEPVVGPGPTGRRRDRRPVRRPARDVCRRRALRRRPVDDALRHDAAFARYRRRRADRLRPVRLLVQSGAVGVQQAAAARAAGRGARRRNRRRIVRAVPVRAVRRGDDRQFRLADGADGIRRSDAADRTAVAGARHPARDFGQRARSDPAVVQDGAGGSVRPSLLCLARARLLHLRLSTGFHHRASAGLSRRSRYSCADRRLGNRRHRSVQHHRLAERGLAAEPAAKALYPVDDLFRARDVDRRFHLVSDHHLLRDHVRRRHRPDLAFDGAADLGAGGPDVRHALVCHAVWICLRQPSGRRLPRRSARRCRVREVRIVHRRSGGCRSCSACCRR